jgi:DNA-binding NtrC family response regulator
VVVACSALAEAADAERAFGPEPGSFASRARGGTLLLDEVGDLPLPAQPAVRALVEKVKGTRVVATTHRVLAGLVERDAFDRALYERLAAEIVEIPALRNRPEDIVPLARRFAEEAGAAPPVALSPGALARLRSYPWPGNILELRNAMERAVRLANGGDVLAEHLPSEVLPTGPSEGRLREQVDSVERDAIIKALADANHNQTHAARRLGISRRALIYKMEKYGLKPPPGEARRRS